MSPEWVSASANVFMALATAIGFIFVYKQIRSSSADHLYGRMHDIHKLFLQKPELRRYLYDLKPPSVEDYSDEALIMAEMVADFFQQVFLELDHLPSVTAEGWRCYMRDILKNSPALRNFVLAKEEWYPSNFVEQLLHRT